MEDNNGTNACRDVFCRVRGDLFFGQRLSELTNPCF